MCADAVDERVVEFNARTCRAILERLKSNARDNEASVPRLRSIAEEGTRGRRKARLGKSSRFPHLAFPRRNRVHGRRVRVVRKSVRCGRSSCRVLGSGLNELSSKVAPISTVFMTAEMTS